MWSRPSGRPAVRAGVDGFELDGSFQPPGRPAEPRQPARGPGQGGGRGRRRRAGFDGHADRVFLVDERGATVPRAWSGRWWPGYVRSEPGATVLYNLICSRVVPETIREAGGVLVRTWSGTPSSRASWPRRGPSSAASTPGTTTRDNYRADSGLIAALVALDAAGGQAAVGGARPLPPLRRLGDQPPRRRPGGSMERWPRATRRMRPISPTG